MRYCLRKIVSKVNLIEFDAIDDIEAKSITADIMDGGNPDNVKTFVETTTKVILKRKGSDENVLARKPT